MLRLYRNVILNGFSNFSKLFITIGKFAFKIGTAIN
jgi:hypothetical protein